jgi:hypothetical protein
VEVVQYQDKKSSIPSKVAITAIKAYKHTLSPLIAKSGVECRFYPTCADYSRQCFEKYGFRQGIIKTYQRLRKCNPYNTDSCIDLP